MHKRHHRTIFLAVRRLRLQFTMTEAAAPKPYDTCMYIALVLGVLTFIGGIICAAIGGFGLTVVGAVMLILAGVGVVPAFILRRDISHLRVMFGVSPT